MPRNSLIAAPIAFRRVGGIPASGARPVGRPRVGVRRAKCIAANPGRISFGSAGIGSPNHVAGELFKIMAGLNLLHVPYRGIAPALNDLLGGQVQVTFASMPSSIEFIKANKLRALAVTTATRSEVLPDVPTVGEFVPGFEASAWFGVGAPKATPSQIIDKLNEQINAALADPKMKARLADLGGTPLVGSACRFRETHCRGNREVGQGGQVLRG